MHARSERWRLAAVVCAALLLRIALAVVIPPLQAPDEQAHLHYVRALARDGRLPVQPAHPGPTWEQYYQPPLAYLLFLPVERLAVAAGASEPGVVHALRLQNCLYATATVVVGWAAVALVTPPGDPRRLLAALVLALLPGFAASGSVVNNDALANLLAAAMWLPLLGRGGMARAGALFGAACLAKLSVLALGPLLLVVPLLRAPQDRIAAARDAAIAACVAGAVLAPWAVRNYVVYGDPLAIGVGSIPFAGLAKLFPPDVVAAAARPAPGRAFLQLWGQFGVFNNLHWMPVPAVLVPLAALATVGWLRTVRTSDALARAALAFAVALVLAIAGLTYFSLRYWAAWQGRYLYTVMVPIAGLLAGGWAASVPGRARPLLIGALALALVLLDAGLVLTLHRFFATVPPARWGLTAEL